MNAVPPRRRDAGATKTRLLEAARELFLARGYSAIGLREVASKAGVDVTLVRRYFGSKERLFAEATDVSENVQEILGAADDALGERLIARVLDARRDVDAPLFALLRSSGDPAVVTRLNAQLEEGLTRNLAKRITADRARIRADMVTALLLGIGVQRVLLQKKPMVSAREGDIAAVFLEAFEAITKLPQGQ
ncbi:TetR/AcrR family transcriptional regulator [Mycobacterium nebraskense]|uniref:TetR/AcrR family transcriptional regulator n=1 Tax=Mycobacterium nebraskense TaxID=244292 RepID=UPI000642590D|nr:TetR/AcrR family transcriptional regulator [Mycobacterium nebraskense]KLO46401.1 TetR family transcriptional regulator [Mycobacterium nebraskense]MBI2693088.1 TetR family transcriptional regulator [Mycobacterium nebraskense]MCV7116944.1 TetR family transcriptional regulator [Mycobacterium nebraskense]